MNPQVLSYRTVVQAPLAPQRRVISPMHSPQRAISPTIIVRTQAPTTTILGGSTSAISFPQQRLSIPRLFSPTQRQLTSFQVNSQYQSKTPEIVQQVVAPQLINSSALNGCGSPRLSIPKHTDTVTILQTQESLNNSMRKSFIDRQQIQLLNTSQNITTSKIPITLAQKGNKVGPTITTTREDGYQQRFKQKQQMMLQNIMLTSKQSTPKQATVQKVVLVDNRLISQHPIVQSQYVSSNISLQPMRLSQTLNASVTLNLANQHLLNQTSFQQSPTLLANTFTETEGAEQSVLRLDDSVTSGKNDKFAPKESFQGEVKNGVYHGRGILVSGNSKAFKNANNGSGCGTDNGLEINPNDFSNFECCYESYEGLFVDGKKQGAGFLKFIDGSTYFGGFQNGMIHGVGAFTFSDPKQAKITGIWKNNILESRLD